MKFWIHNTSRQETSGNTVNVDDGLTQDRELRENGEQTRRIMREDRWGNWTNNRVTSGAGSRLIDRAHRNKHNKFTKVSWGHLWKFCSDSALLWGSFSDVGHLRRSCYLTLSFLWMSHHRNWDSLRVEGGDPRGGRPPSPPPWYIRLTDCQKDSNPQHPHLPGTDRLVEAVVKDILQVLRCWCRAAPLSSKTCEQTPLC